MGFIDILIPLIAGVLMVTSPQIFTRPQGEQFKKISKKLKTWGYVLIGVAALYALIKFVG